MSYNKISVVMNQFNLFGIPKIFKNLYFDNNRPLSAESFTWYISTPIWMTTLSKLENFENLGRFSSADLVISL